MPVASTWMDLVLGVDTHIEVVPTPAPTPTPFPHPHASVVFDPIGYIVGEVVGMLFAACAGQPIQPRGPVLIGGKMATVTGDSASLPIKHIIIPPGTTFLTGITSSSADLVFGSKTVLFRGSNAVRSGDVALSCSDPIDLPTAQVMSTSMGGGVTVVGGPPALDVLALAGSLGMKLVRTKWMAGKAHALVDKVVPQSWKRFRRLAHKTACFFTGHPVNVATGTVSTSAVDLELPGAIPVRFAREYDNNWSDRDLGLGHGWSHSLDQRVWLEEGCVVVLEGDGRELEFSTRELPDRVMRKGDRVWHPVHRATLVAKGELRWELHGADGIIREFAPIPGEFPANKDRGMARLVAMRRRDGQRVELTYDPHARLHRVVDCGGRIVELEHDARGRLRRLWAPSADGTGLRQHAEYRYSDDGDLVSVVDATGKVWSFEYDGHLLVREQDRNGLSFYFQYDSHGSFARCTRTWGDGGIYDHLITYNPKGLETIVSNSLGETTVYGLNGFGMVTRIVQPGGGTIAREYTEALWLAAEIDELGQPTRYTYDERGNLVMRVERDKAVTKIRYVDDRPVELVDASGATWAWSYDNAGRVATQTDALGYVTTYVYEDARLVAIVEADGSRTSFGWDRAGNLVERVFADGTRESWSNDALGREVRFNDAQGNVQRRAYDALGRVIQIEEPDGNVRQIAYDAEGNIVHARDAWRDITLRYTGRGWLAAREVAGTTVQYRYDTEGQRTAVIDEHGSEHRFEIDPTGHMQAEVTFDGKRTQFVRDRGGRLLFAIGPDGAKTSYEHDTMGRRTKASHPDGREEMFAYDRMGRITEVVNADATVTFVRDSAGRVVEERCTRGDVAEPVVIASRRDHRGRRIGLRSSLGADVTIERDVMGDVRRVAQARGTMQPWEATFTRDRFGNETTRTLPGDAVSQWWRDTLGHPLQHVVGREGQAFRARRYRWDKGDRLAAISEVAEGQAPGENEILYTHDGRGALVSATLPSGAVEGRYPDAVGNLFATKERTDRTYGRAGEVRRISTPQGAIELDYDDRGRLSRKRDAQGEWRFHWNASDRLVQVDRPDDTAVTMTYDALGRRLSKNHRGKKTVFVWAGDVVLHEWSEAAEVPACRLEHAELAKLAMLEETKARLRADLPEAWQERWDTVLANDAGYERVHARVRRHEREGEPKPPDDAVGPVVTWLFEPGSFAPLARVTAEDAHSIVTDHVGTPLVVLDSGGVSQAQFVVDTYGRARAAGRGWLCPWRFAGQYADPETGLHYNRFRHYDPSAGRYLSRDPLGLRAGLQAYGYVEDPTRWVDPRGLTTTTPGGCDGKAADSGTSSNLAPAVAPHQLDLFPAEPYDRAKHYGRTPTPEQQAAVPEGMEFDHDPMLVQHYWEGSGDGGLAGHNMTPDERKAFAADVAHGKAATPGDQRRQGAAAAAYSKRKNREYGLK